MQEDDSLVFKSHKKKIHYYSSEKANHIITDTKYIFTSTKKIVSRDHPFKNGVFQDRKFTLKEVNLYK